LTPLSENKLFLRLRYDAVVPISLGMGIENERKTGPLRRTRPMRDKKRKPLQWVWGLVRVSAAATPQRQLMWAPLAQRPSSAPRTLGIWLHDAA
jgi:hypothetical protein